MENIAGILFETDTIGRRTHVRVDLKKFGKQIAPFLKKIGATDDDQFLRDWQRTLTVDEFKQEMYKRIDSWSDK